ncbi:hypothetical protein [Limosilactobacillus reuteri]|uniref:Uncharacterized protein n=1 Tax=Limosilactobacillus reuteri TaxID=1598 RepID=A0A0U5JQ18_LIMRT|nr:hypothetical protein LRLP16767_LR3C6_00916 [Limosilactobacillus reuteri subsp. porcinus]
MKNKKKQYSIIGIIVIVILLIFGIGHHIYKNGGLTAPKTVNLMSKGTRVWLGTEGGLQKDATVDYIDVAKNGKFIQYQVFDDDITLGKASKMSNSDLISLGKKQDKKYFDKSADEVRALRDHKDQIGLQDDLMGDDDLKGDLNNGAWLVMEGTATQKSPDTTNETYTYNKLIPIDQYNSESDRIGKIKLHQSADEKSSPVINKATEYEMVENASPDEHEQENNFSDRHETYSYIRNNRFNALLENMKSVKYLAPKWQTLTFKNTTDNSGNKVISQKMNYKAIDEFNDAGTMDNNVFNLSDSQKQKLFKAKAASHETGSYPELRSAFDKSYYKVVTKNVFKPHVFDDDTELSDKVHQKIYNSTYIGYSTGDDTYLLTKAQNDSQRVVFNK